MTGTGWRASPLAQTQHFCYRGQSNPQAALSLIPHDGNNHKGAITNAIGYLAYGDENAFADETHYFQEKALKDPVHYSPISHALTAAEGSLSNAHVRKAGASSRNGIKAR
jgi:hypothetical protein